MKVIEGKSDNFDNLINESETVLVDFNADWCGPCQMLKPTIEEFAEEKDNIKVISVNVDDEELLAEKYGVSSIPCLVVFKDGKEVKRSVGLVPKEEIESLVGE